MSIEQLSADELKTKLTDILEDAFDDASYAGVTGAYYTDKWDFIKIALPKIIELIQITP